MSAFGSLAGAVLGGAVGGPAGAAIGGGIGGAIGGNKRPGAPQQQIAQESGFNTLPEPVRNAYLNKYLPDILKQYGNKYQTTPLGQAPTGPFDSRALQELQQYSNQNGGIFEGTTGVNPLGVIEPLGEYQQNALQAFGGGINTLGNDLQQYMNPYQNLVQGDINRQADISQNRLLDLYTRGSGFGGLNNSALRQILGQNEEGRQQLQNQAQVQNYQQALGLRRQTLQDMLAAGNQVQGQGQSVLNALNPALSQTTPFARSSQLASQLGQFQPSNNAYNYNTPAPRQSALDRALAGFTLGAGFGGGGFGGGQQQQQQGGGGANLGNLLSYFG